MDLKKEKFFTRLVIYDKKERFSLEDSMIIPDVKPDVLNIIDYSCNPIITKREYNNGKIRIDGELNTYVIYLADDENNNVRSVYSKFMFSKSFEVGDNYEGADFSCRPIVNECNFKILNGRKISVIIEVTLENTGICKTEKEFFKPMEDNTDFQSVNEVIDLVSVKEQGENIITLKDSVLFDDAVSDVLKCNYSIINKENKISYNKVLTKADISMDFVYLTKDEEIKSKSIELPIMGFIEIRGISEGDLYKINYELTKAAVSVNSMEDNSINVDFEIKTSGFVFENNKVEVMKDMYCLDKIAVPSYDVICTNKSVDFYVEKCKISENLNIDEMNSNNLINYNVSFQNINYSINEDEINIEYEVSVKFLYKSESSNKFETCERKIIQSQKIQCKNLLKKSSIILDIYSENKNVNFEDNKLVSIDIDVCIELEINGLQDIEYINSCIVNDIKDDEDYSFIVYYVKENDTLWKIAKKFRSTIKDICELNSIENEDDLLARNQLYIPR